MLPRVAIVWPCTLSFDAYAGLAKCIEAKKGHVFGRRWA